MNLAYSSNAYMKYPIVEAIERIAAIGYTGIELMADVPHAWPETTTDDDIAAICEAVAKSSLTISNINAFMMKAVQDFWHPSWIEPDPQFRRRRVEHTKNALTLASRLGARSITTEPGGPLEPGMSRDRAMDVFVEGLGEALLHAERQNVLLLVEPEPGLLIENAEQFEELAERVDSPAFGLNLDVGHFYCVADPGPHSGPYPLVQTIERLSAYTKHYHLEDIAASRVHKHLVPGTGAIDFKSTLEAIRATGYDGWLTVELYPYLDDPDGAGAAARRHLVPLLESL